MNFKDFKNIYLKAVVEEFPNNREGKTPLVTVKVITYNHVNYIKECLDSILMQKTDFDFEILIAEDDSNDGTREVCIAYAREYPNKIRLLLNSRENNIFINEKPTGTFNNVYANFNIDSKYIAIIEGDDYWVDNYSLQKRVDFLENNEDHVLCFHNTKIYHQNTNKFHERFLVPFNKSISLEKKQILNSQIPTLTLLYRTGFVDVFEGEMIKIISGDVILRGKLANYGKARYMHDIEPSVYRIHNGGISSGASFEENKEASLQARFYLLEFYKSKNWDIDPVNESLANAFFSLFMSNLIKEKKLKISYLTKCLTYSSKSKTSFLTICKNAFSNRKNKKIKI
jgi:glycosyltransferase involved in cell wall biosynthesis